MLIVENVTASFKRGYILKLFQDWRKREERIFRKSLLSLWLAASACSMPLFKMSFLLKAPRAGTMPSLCAYKEREISRAEANAPHRIIACAWAVIRNNSRG